MAPSLKVALGEKEKSFAQKRSDLAGEFPERVTEVPTALAGQCLCSGQLWALKPPSHPGAPGPPADNHLPPTLHTPRKLESQNGRTPPLYNKVLLHLFVFFIGLTRKWPQGQKKAVFIFHDGISFS